MLESCSREDNGVRGRSAGSLIGALFPRPLPFVHILRFVPVSTHKESFATDMVFFLFGRKEGRNARRTEALHRGGAGKGEDPAPGGVPGSLLQQGPADPRPCHKTSTKTAFHGGRSAAFQDACTPTPPPQTASSSFIYSPVEVAKIIIPKYNIIGNLLHAVYYITSAQNNPNHSQLRPKKCALTVRDSVRREKAGKNGSSSNERQFEQSRKSIRS